MAQKNRANMLTDIVSNIYNNLINFITGQNAQDRFVNLLDSSPNILSDKDQASGYVGTDANNEMLSGYYIEQLSVVAAQTLIFGNDLVSLKAYLLDDADAGNRIIKVLAAGGVTNQFYQYGIDATTGEIGTYDITTDVFTPIVSSAQTLSQTLVLGNTSGANDIEFDATQGLLFANTSRLREGTIDAGLGGLKGIAQICGAGYELKWENGRLYVMGSSGNTIRQSLYNLTTTPTATDDTTLGYAIGSLWTLDDGTTYVCSDDTLGAAVWAIGGIPTLQQVTTAGATTTNSISVTNGTDTVIIQPNQLKIANSIGYGTIAATNLTADPNFELPDKPTGTYTFAMLSDITGGVTSVSAGTNISVTGTSTAPIINSLSDRYSTSSTSSNTIDNGNGKIFTVDANLAYIPLQEVLIVNSPSNHMHGTVVSYSGTTLTVDINSHTGSAGPYTSWVINLDGTPVDAITGVGTANEIAYFTGGQVIASLPVATYPSLTELALVKGVTGSDIQTQLNAKKDVYAVQCGAAIQVLVADSTNYHMGIAVAATLNTTSSIRRFKFTNAGSVKEVSWNLFQSVNGSNETVTLYLRNESTSTDNLIGTFTSDFGANSVLSTLFTGLSITVNTTNDYVFKIATPAFGTNPTNWLPAAIISVQKT
jgi:hypothetical protein